MRMLHCTVVVGVFAGLTGCALDAHDETTTADCQLALKSSNGMSAQGLSYQGISGQGMGVQGLASQGMWLQGLSMQGLATQGLASQGLSAQGISSQGLSAQGLSAQGLTAQGLTAQGLTAQGRTAQGLSAQGLSAQGIWHNGMWHNGMWNNGFWANGLWLNGLSAGVSPQILEGVALRGTTVEEARAWLSGGSTELGPDNVVLITLEDGVLRGLTRDRELLADSELVGLLVPFSTTTGDVLWISLSSVSTHPDAADLLLYGLEFEGQNLCGEGNAGLFVPGVWDETGLRHDQVDSGGRSIDTTYACTRGVITKCAAWGYRPWVEGPAIHEACTRMARADYCGDGRPHTEEGTTIDMFDTRGIQIPVEDDGLSFEAGWGPNGAVCVREPRYVDTKPTGEVVYPSCWADLPVCETWTAALEHGAVLGNDSAHTLRALTCGQ